MNATTDKKKTPRKPFDKEKWLKNQAKKLKWEAQHLARKHGTKKASSFMEERYGWRGKLAILSASKSLPSQEEKPKTELVWDKDHLEI